VETISRRSVRSLISLSHPHPIKPNHFPSNVIGFEYWSDPNSRQNGFINWQVNGQQTTTLYAPAVGPDQGTGGSGVGQRLIPEEPMAIVLNLGISRMF
jgi:hypothetical protein